MLAFQEGRGSMDLVTESSLTVNHRNDLLACSVITVICSKLRPVSFDRNISLQWLRDALNKSRLSACLAGMVNEFTNYRISAPWPVRFENVTYGERSFFFFFWWQYARVANGFNQLMYSRICPVGVKSNIPRFVLYVCFCLRRMCQNTLHLLVLTRWFKYDRDKLWLVYTQSVPVIFEPPCTCISWETWVNLTEDGKRVGLFLERNNWSLCAT
jgi:hypothetical protein